MQSRDTLVMAIFDRWSTHFMSKSGTTYVFPVMVDELESDLRKLSNLIEHREKVTELLDYTREFKQRFDGVEITNQHPFNLEMLTLVEGLAGGLPPEAHLALENIRRTLE
jgi:hypothetical protein